MTMSRRDVLGSAALAGGWIAFSPSLGLGQETQPGPGGGAATGPAPAAGATAGGPAAGPYQLAPLPYGYGDLEPFLDAPTMKLHHDIHHAGYVKGANEALAELERIRRTGGDAIKQVGAVTANLAFHLSGHVLHELFWQSMKPGGGGDPPAGSETARLLARDFGSVEAFRANLSAAAAQVKGSGWALLGYEKLAGRLLVVQIEKHENQHACGLVPLLAVDVWEHAYYLKYQNRRADFIKAFHEVIDWESVEKRLIAARA